jgi:hypothetical protein
MIIKEGEYHDVIVVWTLVRFLSITTKCDFASHKWQGELYYIWL